MTMFLLPNPQQKLKRILPLTVWNTHLSNWKSLELHTHFIQVRPNLLIPLVELISSRTNTRSSAKKKRKRNSFFLKIIETPSLNYEGVFIFITVLKDTTHEFYPL